MTYTPGDSGGCSDTSEHGVSPVVAVILLVALTVIASSTIFMVVFDTSQTPTNTGSAGVQVAEETETAVTFTQITSGTSQSTVAVSALGTPYKLATGEHTEVLPLSGQQVQVFTERGDARTLLTSQTPTQGFTPDITVDRHGTEDYETIQSGLDAASDGDVVVVERATYSENVNLTTNNVTLVAEYGTTLADANPDENVIHINANGTTVLNLRIDGNPNPADTAHYARHGIAIYGAHNSLAGNTFVNASSPESESAGVFIDGPYNTIVHNEFQNNEHGIILKSGADTSTVTRNIFGVAKTVDVHNLGSKTLNANQNQWVNGADVEGPIVVGQSLTTTPSVSPSLDFESQNSLNRVGYKTVSSTTKPSSAYERVGVNSSETQWVKTDPGGNWEATGATKTVSEYSHTNTQWSKSSPGSDWSRTGNRNLLRVEETSNTKLSDTEPYGHWELLGDAIKDTSIGECVTEKPTYTPINDGDGGYWKGTSGCNMDTDYFYYEWKEETKKWQEQDYIYEYEYEQDVYEDVQYYEYEKVVYDWRKPVYENE